MKQLPAHDSPLSIPLKCWIHFPCVTPHWALRKAVGARKRPHQPNSNLLGKLDAELSEVLPGGCQVVTNDGDILLDVEDDRGDVRTLVTHMFHILPLHLQGQNNRDSQTLWKWIEPVVGYLFFFFLTLMTPKVHQPGKLKTVAWLGDKHLQCNSRGNLNTLHPRGEQKDQSLQKHRKNRYIKKVLSTPIVLKFRVSLLTQPFLTQYTKR